MCVVRGKGVEGGKFWVVRGKGVMEPGSRGNRVERGKISWEGKVQGETENEYLQRGKLGSERMDFRGSYSNVKGFVSGSRVSSRNWIPTPFCNPKTVVKNRWRMRFGVVEHVMIPWV